MITSASGSATPAPFAAAIVTVDPHSGLQRKAIDPVRDYDLLVAYVQNEYDRQAIAAYRQAMLELILSMTTPVVLRRIIRDLIIALTILIIADSMNKYVLTGPAI